MSDTIRETVITSQTAERMLSRVSPIYDNSYVGLWMFEAIGREYDSLWSIINSIPDQLFLESATWGIELWEKRYGIEPDSTISIADRRKKVIAMRDKLSNMNNSRLESWLAEKSGGTASVIDHVSAYTFGISIDSYYGMASLDLVEAESYINKNKPSHLSYRMDFTSERTAETYVGVAVHTAGTITTTMTQIDAQTLLCLTDESSNPLMDENNLALFD